MKILLDKEIDLNQKGVDLLNTKSYSQTLENLILKSPDGAPLTIGLFGEWGSGKSSIIKTLAGSLAANNGQSVKFVLYDAWKYANDSFRRTFIQHLQNELGIKMPGGINLYANTNSDKSFSWKINRAYVIIFLVVLALLYFAVAPADDTSKDELKKNVFLFVPYLAVLVGILMKAIAEKKVTVVEPMMFAPEQFEKCFKNLISTLFEHKKGGNWKKLKAGVGKKKVDKLVIVIDNIDRCHKEIAYELLTNTKNFIDGTSDVIFLIPVDDVALKKHLFKNQNEDRKENEEFLRKYFNVTLRIKPYKATEILNFANAINNNHGLGLKPDTVNIIAKEFVSNPRKIIQFFNNLQLEFIALEKKYDSEFVSKNELAIAKFLIIREEWPLYYQRVCSSPDLFLKHEQNRQLEGYKSEVESLEIFLLSTKFGTSALDYSSLQKILMNNDRENTLPKEFIQSLYDKKFDLLDQIISENGQSADEVAVILLFRLEQAIKYDLIDSEIPELLHQIFLFFPSQKELRVEHYSNLELLINSKKEAIDRIRNYDSLIDFGLHASSKNINFILKEIRSTIERFELIEGTLETDKFDLIESVLKGDDPTLLGAVEKWLPLYFEKNQLIDKLWRFSPASQSLLLDTRILEAQIPWLAGGNLQSKQWLPLIEKLAKTSPIIPYILSKLASLDKTYLSLFDTFEVLAVLLTRNKADQNPMIIEVVDKLHEKLIANLSSGNWARSIESDENKSFDVVYDYILTALNDKAVEQKKVQVILAELIKQFGTEEFDKRITELIAMPSADNTDRIRTIVGNITPEILESSSALLEALYTTSEGANIFDDVELLKILEVCLDSGLNDRQKIALARQFESHKGRTYQYDKIIDARPHLFLKKAKPSTANVNIARNELCPCGSGKRFKNCHGANIEIQGINLEANLAGELITEEKESGPDDVFLSRILDETESPIKKKMATRIIIKNDPNPKSSNPIQQKYHQRKTPPGKK